MHEGLQKVFDAIPIKCNKIFIAGGAAHNFELTEDVDLWVPNNSVQGAVDIFNGIQFPKTSFFGNPMKQKYADQNKNFQLIGEFYFAPIKKMVQILVTEEEYSLKTLNRFDLGVHAVAVHRDGKVVESPYYQPQNKWIDFLSRSPNTLRRYVKFSLRYGLDIDPYILTSYYSGLEKIEYTPDEEVEVEGSPAELNKYGASVLKVPISYSWSDLGTKEEFLVANLDPIKAQMMSYISYGEDPKSGKSEE